MCDDTKVAIEQEVVHLEVPNIERQALVGVHSQQCSVKLLEERLVREDEHCSTTMLFKNVLQE